MFCLDELTSVIAEDTHPPRARKRGRDSHGACVLSHQAQKDTQMLPEMSCKEATVGREALRALRGTGWTGQESQVERKCRGSLKRARLGQRAGPEKHLYGVLLSGKPA